MCDSYPEFYCEEFPKAKKEHKCSNCARTILIGEKYQKIKGVWDGEFSQYKICADCAKLQKYVFDNFHPECPTITEFGEVLYELDLIPNLDDLYPDEPEDFEIYNGCVIVSTVDWMYRKGRTWALTAEAEKTLPIDFRLRFC